MLGGWGLYALVKYKIQIASNTALGFWLKIFLITLGGEKRLFADGTIPAALKVTSDGIERWRSGRQPGLSTASWGNEGRKWRNFGCAASESRAVSANREKLFRIDTNSDGGGKWRPFFRGQKGDPAHAQVHSLKLRG